jgi:hypothetical protein
LAQQEQGELEATQREQNRVRLQPSLRDVTRAEAALTASAMLEAGVDVRCAISRSLFSM